MFVTEQKRAREEAARRERLYTRYQHVASPKEISEYYGLEGDKAQADFLASKKKTFEERMAKRQDTPEKGRPATPPKKKRLAAPEVTEEPASPGPGLVSAPTSVPPTPLTEPDPSPMGIMDTTHLDPETTHAHNRLRDEKDQRLQDEALDALLQRTQEEMEAGVSRKEKAATLRALYEIAEEEEEEDLGISRPASEVSDPGAFDTDDEKERREQTASLRARYEMNIAPTEEPQEEDAFDDGHDVDMEDPNPGDEDAELPTVIHGYSGGIEERQAKLPTVILGLPLEAKQEDPDGGGDGGWEDTDDEGPPAPRRPHGGPVQFVPMQAEVAHQEFYNAGPPALPIAVQGPISDIMKFIPKAVPVYDVGAQQMFHTSFLSKGSVRQKVAIAGGYLLLRPSQIIVVVPKVLRGTSTELGTYLQGRFPLGGNIDGKSYSNTSLLGEVIRRLPGRVTISY